MLWVTRAKSLAEKMQRENARFRLTLVNDGHGGVLISCSLIRRNVDEQPRKADGRTGLNDNDYNHLLRPGAGRGSGPDRRD